MVVIGTFAWQSLNILPRIPLTGALVMILVTIVTVMSDLAIAVVVGVVVSALAYSWNTALCLHAMTSIEPDGTKIYQLEGPLFSALLRVLLGFLCPAKTRTKSLSISCIAELLTNLPYKRLKTWLTDMRPWAK